MYLAISTVKYFTLDSLVLADLLHQPSSLQTTGVIHNQKGTQGSQPTVL